MQWCPTDGKLQEYRCPCCGDSLEESKTHSEWYCNKCDVRWSIYPLLAKTDG